MQGTPTAAAALAVAAASATRAARYAPGLHNNGLAALLPLVPSLLERGASALALFPARRAAHVSASRPLGNGTTTVDRGDPASRSEAAGIVNTALRRNGGSDPHTANEGDEQNAKADPELCVFGSGTSSAVLARLPLARGAKLLATRGTVIGKSPGVVSRFRVEENALAAVRGSVLVYEELSCANDIKSESGDVFLAPKNSWDSVAVLSLDGTNEVQMRGGALLARTERVVLLGTGGRTSGLRLASRVFSCRVTGRGSVAIAAAGGLHKIVLEDNEQYMVDPRRMVAWDLCTSQAPNSRIQPLELSTEEPKENGPRTSGSPMSEAVNPKSASVNDVLAKQSVDSGASTAATMYMDAVRVRLTYAAKYLWAMTSRWIREIALGRGDYVMLTGPGVVYLSGRQAIRGLQRIGIGMDWVARNLPSLPARPVPIKSLAMQTPVASADQAHLAKSLYADVSLVNNPLTSGSPDSKSHLPAIGGVGGVKLTTKAVDKPPVKIVPQRE